MSLNIVDKVVAFFDPAAGIRRSRARAALNPKASYDGAKDGRRTAGWTTTGASANAETSGGLVALRDRARDLVRNNPLSASGQGKCFHRLCCFHIHQSAC